MSTSISSPSLSISGNLKQAVRRHPLFFFFLMAYTFSWIMIVPYILAQWGFLHGNFLFSFVIKSFGPFLAAVIVLGITEGKTGVLHLRRSCVQWRVGWQWYLFILLGIPALFLLSLLVMPGAWTSFQGFPPHFPVVYLVNFILIFFAGGPLGEEPGWRGFALPRMHPRFGVLRGTLLLGVLWACWHLPDFLTDAQRSGPGTNFVTLFTVNFPIFFILVVSLAVIFTWVFNHTGGSVFMAILLHASINTFGILQPFFTAPSVTDTDLFVCVGAVVLALVIIILTHGQLGYQQVPNNMELVEMEA